MSKPVVDFSVVHASVVIKFRTNADTRMSIVWDAYAQNRKWLPSDKAKFRLYSSKDECIRLSETVYGNHIIDGAKLKVVELGKVRDSVGVGLHVIDLKQRLSLGIGFGACELAVKV